MPDTSGNEQARGPISDGNDEEDSHSEGGSQAEGFGDQGFSDEDDCKEGPRQDRSTCQGRSEGCPGQEGCNQGCARKGSAGKEDGSRQERPGQDGSRQDRSEEGCPGKEAGGSDKGSQVHRYEGACKDGRQGGSGKEDDGEGGASEDHHQVRTCKGSGARSKEGKCNKEFFRREACGKQGHKGNRSKACDHNCQEVGRPADN